MEKSTRTKDKQRIGKVSILRSQGLEEADAVSLITKHSVIVDLSGNALRSTNELLQAFDFSKLLKLDLSNNKIDEIPPKKSLAGLTSLQILYLHANQIVDWGNLDRLTGLPSVLHITLFHNPVVNRSGYRHFVVNSIKSLIALDLHVITDEEKCDTVIAQRPRFRTLTTQMNFVLPPGGGALTNSVFQIKELHRHLFSLKRIYEKNSPATLIQRNYRGYVQRVKYQELVIKRYEASTRISSVYRGWRTRKHLCYTLPWTYLKHCLPNLPKYHKALATIKHFVDNYRKLAKAENIIIEAANKIKRLFASLVVAKKNYEKPLEVHETPCFYYLKDQKKLLLEILAREKVLEKVEVYDTQTVYDTIRIPDPEDAKWSPFPLVFAHRLSKGIKLRRHHKEPIFASKNPKKSIYLTSCEILNRIKQIKCVYPKMLERYREKAIQKKKKRVFDTYSDLGYAEVEASTFAKLVSCIFEYNKKVKETDKEILGIYFAPIMKKIAAVIDIQAWYRGARLRQKLGKSLVQEVVQNRATLLLQRCWRWSSLKTRLNFLSKVKGHCDKIVGNTILLEESLYLKLIEHAEKNAGKGLIMEQEIQFGFAGNKTVPWYPKEAKRAHHRYFELNYVLPNWMGIPFLKVSGNIAHLNELAGLIHSTFSMVELVPYSKLVDTKYKGIEVPLSFVKFTCVSQDEARRRAYLVALKTFSKTHKEFIRLYTPGMLQDPLNCAQHLKMWKVFGIVKSKEVDGTNENALSISNMEMTQWPSIISHKPIPLLQLDCVKLKDSEVYSNAFGNIGTATDEIIDINDVFDQENIASEEQRTKTQEETGDKVNKRALYKELLKYKAKYARKEKEQLADLKKKQEVSFLEEARTQAENQRTFQKLVRIQHKEVYDKQLDAFHKILQEEKATIKSILDKNREEQKKIKSDLKDFAKKCEMKRRQKKEDREFCVSFMQIQNLISKQLKITDYQKRDHQSFMEKRNRVKDLKRSIVEKSFRQEARIRVTNLDTLTDEKKKLPVLRKYEVYLQKKQESERRIPKKILDRSVGIGGLHRAHVGKRGKSKPAIFREELYPIVHKNNITHTDSRDEVDVSLPNF